MAGEQDRVSIRVDVEGAAQAKQQLDSVNAAKREAAQNPPERAARQAAQTDPAAQVAATAAVAANTKQAAQAMQDVGTNAAKAARPIDDIRADINEMRLLLSRVRLGDDVGMSAEQIRRKLADLRAEGGKLLITNGDVRTGLQALGLAFLSISPQMTAFISVFSSLSIAAEGLKGSIVNVGLAFRSMLSFVLNPVFLGLAAIVGGIVTAFNQWSDAVAKNREEHKKNAAAIADEAAKAKAFADEVSGRKQDLGAQVQEELRGRGVGPDQVANVTRMVEQVAAMAGVSREEAVPLVTEAAGRAAKTGKPMLTPERMADLLAVQKGGGLDGVPVTDQTRLMMLEAMATPAAVKKARALIPTDESPIGKRIDRENYEYNLGAARHAERMTATENLRLQEQEDIARLKEQSVTVMGIPTVIGEKIRNRNIDEVFGNRGGNVTINTGSNNITFQAPDARRGAAPNAAVRP